MQAVCKETHKIHEGETTVIQVGLIKCSLKRLQVKVSEIQEKQPRMQASLLISRRGPCQQATAFET